jgi:hypothetical protein
MRGRQQLIARRKSQRLQDGVDSLSGIGDQPKIRRRHPQKPPNGLLGLFNQPIAASAKHLHWLGFNAAPPIILDLQNVARNRAERTVIKEGNAFFQQPMRP